MEHFACPQSGGVRSKYPTLFSPRVGNCIYSRASLLMIRLSLTFPLQDSYTPSAVQKCLQVLQGPFRMLAEDKLHLIVSVVFTSQATENQGWWNEETVAVVTGASRGIGLEITRQLADKGIFVVMTARRPREELSSDALTFLQEGRRNVVFHTLDIDRPQSVSDFVEWLKMKSGFVDILVNNAGVAKSEVDWEFMQKNNVDSATIIGDNTWTDGISEKYESAKECIGTNYYGTKRVTEAVVPLLRPSSYQPRIVNVSSLLGLLSFLRDEEVRKKLEDGEKLSEEKIQQVLEMFLEDVKWERDLGRWPLKFPSYALSKVALNGYTRVLARRLEGKACVNSVHPGYVMTDMTLGTGNLSPSQGAHHVVCLALSPPPSPSGHNFLQHLQSTF